MIPRIGFYKEASTYANEPLDVYLQAANRAADQYSLGKATADKLKRDLGSFEAVGTDGEYVSKALENINSSLSAMAEPDGTYRYDQMVEGVQDLANKFAGDKTLAKIITNKQARDEADKMRSDLLAKGLTFDENLARAEMYNSSFSSVNPDGTFNTYINPYAGRKDWNQAAQKIMERIQPELENIVKPIDDKNLQSLLQEGNLFEIGQREFKDADTFRSKLNEAYELAHSDPALQQYLEYYTEEDLAKLLFTSGNIGSYSANNTQIKPLNNILGVKSKDEESSDLKSLADQSRVLRMGSVDVGNVDGFDPLPAMSKEGKTYTGRASATAQAGHGNPVGDITVSDPRIKERYEMAKAVVPDGKNLSNDEIQKEYNSRLEHYNNLIREKFGETTQYIQLPGGTDAYATIKDAINTIGKNREDIVLAGYSGHNGKSLEDQLKDVKKPFDFDTMDRSNFTLRGLALTTGKGMKTVNGGIGATIVDGKGNSIDVIVKDDYFNRRFSGYYDLINAGKDIVFGRSKVGDKKISSTESMLNREGKWVTGEKAHDLLTFTNSEGESKNITAKPRARMIDGNVELEYIVYANGVPSSNSITAKQLQDLIYPAFTNNNFVKLDRLTKAQRNK